MIEGRICGVGCDGRYGSAFRLLVLMQVINRRVLDSSATFRSGIRPLRQMMIN